VRAGPVACDGHFGTVRPVVRGPDQDAQDDHRGRVNRPGRVHRAAARTTTGCGRPRHQDRPRRHRRTSIVGRPSTVCRPPVEHHHVRASEEKVYRVR